MQTIFNNLRRIAKSVAVIAALLASPAAFAQDFPTKQVTFVVPFSPGGTNDTVGRFLAEQLGKVWKQTAVVENHPGAGSAIGTAHVTQAKPDGHTLLINSGSLTTSAAIQKNLPFDPIKDLQPIAMASVGDLIILTGKREAIPTLKDLESTAKAKKLFYGTPGLGTLSHLSSELMNDAMGIDMEAVHYPGGGDVIPDLGGGRLDVYICSVNDARKGVGTPVAVMSETRAKAYPDLPTTVELGYPDALANIWIGVFGPANLPKDVADKINRDVVAVMKTSEAAKFLEAQASAASDMSVDQFTSHVHEELKKWADLAQKHQIAAK
jgi:tripartite-type tricarboxylate transporter receptor subunit TctC